ncbi:MAG: cysteine hydrolase [Pseudomonadota bacterium]
MTLVNAKVPILIANHFQNENCHPDGKIKVGISVESAWRDLRLGNARKLFNAARRSGIQIVHVRLAVDPDYRGVDVNTPLIEEWVELGAWREGTWGVAFLEGLGPVDYELVITHTRNSAFHGTDLQDRLAEMGADLLICCGVSTAYTVEGTVRHATDIGYEVTVAADACSTATAAQHEASLAAMERLARICTTDELIAEFAKR